PLHPSVPLVEAHARAADTILRQAFVLPVGEAATASMVLGVALLVVLATWRFGPVLGLLATAFLLAGYVGLAFGMFCDPSHRVYPLVAPPLAGIVAYVFELIAQARHNRKVPEMARLLQSSTKDSPHPTAT